MNTSISNRNWLSVINIILDENYTEYPSANVIEDAQRRLFDPHYADSDLRVFIRTTQRYPASHATSGHGGVARIALVSESWSLPRLHIHINTDWERHPDGTGWLFQWRPVDADGEIIVCPLTNELSERIYSANKRIDETSDSLRQKVGLGELTSDAADRSIVQLVEREWRDIREHGLRN